MHPANYVDEIAADDTNSWRMKGPPCLDRGIAAGKAVCTDSFHGPRYHKIKAKFRETQRQSQRPHAL